MPKKDKLVKRLLSCPSDFSYSELVTVLGYFGYEEVAPGQTGGSGRKFIRRSDQSVMMFHEPHPKSIMKSYVLKEVIKKLKECGDL